VAQLKRLVDKLQEHLMKAQSPLPVRVRPVVKLAPIRDVKMVVSPLPRQYGTENWPVAKMAVSTYESIHSAKLQAGSTTKMSAGKTVTQSRAGPRKALSTLQATAEAIK
jgi:hypothetical protein